MILPPSATRARALPQRHALKPQPCRKTSVKVSALFGGKAPAASKDGGNVEELRNTAKRFGGPSEAANKAVAQAAKSLGRVNTNARSNDLYGKWEIIYASGNTGLTALDGKISSFTVTRDSQYENECTSRVAGIFPGYAKEGGTLKVTGGSKFELLQEYREFKRGPGGVLVEEVEDAPVRGFEILALTPDTLMLKLAITSYTDEESGRRVTVPPEGDYFLVWSKAGKAAARSAPVAQEEDEEAEQAPAKSGGGLFGGFSFGGSKPSFATIAEQGQGQGQEEEDPRARRQREAAEAREAKREQAEERKRAQQEAAEERQRAQQEAAEERQRARAAKQADDEDLTEVVKRPAFALGSIFGGKKAEDEEEESDTVISKPVARGGLFGRKPPVEEDDDESETAVVTRPFAGLFGGKKQEPQEEEEAPKRGGLFGGSKRTPQAPATARGGTQRGGTQRGGMSSEERKRAREEAAEQKRREAEEKKRAAVEAREKAKAEAEQRKQEEQRTKAEAAAMRQRIQEVVSEMQSDVKQAGADAKELTAALRTAEREGRDAIKAGEAAAKRLDGAESKFAVTEAELDEANGIFNEIAGQLREKQREIDSADAELKKLENDLVKV